MPVPHDDDDDDRLPTKPVKTDNYRVYYSLSQFRNLFKKKFDNTHHKRASPNRWNEL